MKKHGYLLGPRCEQEVNPGESSGFLAGQEGLGEEEALGRGGGSTPAVCQAWLTEPGQVRTACRYVRGWVCVPNHDPKFTQRDPVGPQHAEGSREPPLLVLGASRGRHREAGSSPAGPAGSEMLGRPGAGDSIRTCPATPDRTFPAAAAPCRPGGAGTVTSVLIRPDSLALRTAFDLREV